MKELDRASKHMEDAVKQMDQVFKEIDKVFEKVDKIMDEVQVKATEQVNSRLTHWEVHRSWMPRKVGKRWYMPGRLLYRKFVLSPGGGYWKYGTEFDVMKDSK